MHCVRNKARSKKNNPLEQRTTLPIQLHLFTSYRLWLPENQNKIPIVDPILRRDFRLQEIADSLYRLGMAA